MTPMLQQYFAAKAEYPNVLILMRVGDFYEAYREDAEILAKTLEITLTGREDGEGNRIPMSGVPFHSVEKHLARLSQAGHKVAICDPLSHWPTGQPAALPNVLRMDRPEIPAPESASDDELSGPYLYGLMEDLIRDAAKIQGFGYAASIAHDAQKIVALIDESKRRAA